jgi:enamine deaminase RidA (YjgF/YER057c/UK114 family)
VKWFSHKPARTAVAVSKPPKGADIEIEAIAIL